MIYIEKQTEVDSVLSFARSMVFHSGRLSCSIMEFIEHKDQRVRSSRPFRSVEELHCGQGHGKFSENVETLGADLDRNNIRHLMIWDNGFTNKDVSLSDLDCYAAGFFPDLVQIISLEENSRQSNIVEALRRCNSFSPVGFAVAGREPPFDMIRSVDGIAAVILSAFDQEGAIVWSKPGLTMSS